MVCVQTFSDVKECDYATIFNRRQRSPSPLSSLFTSTFSAGAYPRFYPNANASGSPISKRRFVSYVEAASFPVMCNELDNVDESSSGPSFEDNFRASPSLSMSSHVAGCHLTAVSLPLDGIGCYTSADECVVVIVL